MILLIRHASAGDRDAWEGADRLRPLDKRGRRQAKELVQLLSAYEISSLLSSPAVRCIQTIEPLAHGRSLSIVPREELTEERQHDDGAALVKALTGAATALSCHGGLSEAVCGVSQKKGEVLVLDGVVVVERFRARGR